jgi:sulfide:quinone oxidoreductase
MEKTMSDAQRFDVLIAGSGPAALEAALVLQRVAGDLVETTILTPDEHFAHQPITVLSPFAAHGSQRQPLATLASGAGASLRRGTVASVDSAARTLRTGDGETIAYDALLIAVGGVQQLPYPRALAFGRAGTDERMHGLIQDVEAGYVKRIAFIVAPGVSWPLPLYELALMTAERAFGMCAHVELTFVTPEESPLALFGQEVSRDVAEMLEVAGIHLWTGAQPEVPECNVVELCPQGERVLVDRVVTLPTLAGPAIDGLPHDAAGFLPVDDHGRVTGAPGVYAAGDASNFAIKQGGIACQQADAAAEAIAASAGAAIEPAPFTPVLLAVLLTERETLWLRRDLSTPTGQSGTSALPPQSWPPTKIVGRELSRHLGNVAVHSIR